MIIMIIITTIIIKITILTNNDSDVGLHVAEDAMFEDGHRRRPHEPNMSSLARHDHKEPRSIHLVEDLVLFISIEYLTR